MVRLLVLLRLLATQGPRLPPKTFKIEVAAAFCEKDGVYSRVLQTVCCWHEQALGLQAVSSPCLEVLVRLRSPKSPGNACPQRCSGAKFSKLSTAKAAATGGAGGGFVVLEAQRRLPSAFAQDLTDRLEGHSQKMLEAGILWIDVGVSENRGLPSFGVLRIRILLFKVLY